jgi:hypothetical protein
LRRNNKFPEKGTKGIMQEYSLLSHWICRTTTVNPKCDRTIQETWEIERKEDTSL